MVEPPERLALHAPRGILGWPSCTEPHPGRERRACEILPKAMSAENVETLRQGFEALNSGDIERILEFAHPDFEGVVSPEFSAEPDTYRGHEGMRRYVETFQDAMDEIRFEADQVWDAGACVVALVRVTARGKQTGIPVEQRMAQLWTMRDGKAIGVRTYSSLRQALKDAGIAE